MYAVGPQSFVDVVVGDDDAVDVGLLVQQLSRFLSIVLFRMHTRNTFRKCLVERFDFLLCLCLCYCRLLSGESLVLAVFFFHKFFCFFFLHLFIQTKSIKNYIVQFVWTEKMSIVFVISWEKKTKQMFVDNNRRQSLQNTISVYMFRARKKNCTNFHNEWAILWALRHTLLFNLFLDLIFQILTIQFSVRFFFVSK